MIKSSNMSFLEHLEVLRWHIIRSIFVTLVFTILAFIFKNIIFDKILFAIKNPDFLTYKIICKVSGFFGFSDNFCIQDLPFNLINISMSGQFSAHITTSLIVGIIISFPYFVWEMWRFIKPALHKNEKIKVRGVVFFSSLLFFTGVLFGYFVVSPLSINFLGGYFVSSMIENQISFSSYINTVSILTLANGLIFQLPIFVYFLSKAGILTESFMKKYRKHSLVIILILSAIITPPDVTSQILLSLPILFLYEISIKISKYVNPKS